MSVALNQTYGVENPDLTPEDISLGVKRNSRLSANVMNSFLYYLSKQAKDAQENGGYWMEDKQYVIGNVVTFFFGGTFNVYKCKRDDTGTPPPDKEVWELVSQNGVLVGGAGTDTGDTPSYKTSDMSYKSIAIGDPVVTEATPGKYSFNQNSVFEIVMKSDNSLLTVSAHIDETDGVCYEVLESTRKYENLTKEQYLSSFGSPIDFGGNAVYPSGAAISFGKNTSVSEGKYNIDLFLSEEATITQYVMYGEYPTNVPSPSSSTYTPRPLRPKGIFPSDLDGEIVEFVVPLAPGKLYSEGLIDESVESEFKPILETGNSILVAVNKTGAYLPEVKEGWYDLNQINISDERYEENNKLNGFIGVKRYVRNF